MDSMEKEAKTIEYYKEQALIHLQLAQEAIEDEEFIAAFILLETAKQFNSMAMYMQSPMMLN